jgi:hypothetical protein
MLLIDILYKLTAASKIRSSLSGQAGHGQLDVSCRGPAPGDVSYHYHEAEKRQIFEGPKERGLAMSQGLNAAPFQGLPASRPLGQCMHSRAFVYATQCHRDL